MTNLREISDREEVPGWAVTLRDALADMNARIDRVTSTRRSLGENISATRQMPSRTPQGYDADLEDGRIEMTTSGQSRRDALNRKLTGELAEMRALLNKATRQPSTNERNQLAHAFNRADSVYGSLGRATPSPMPGEKPMAFRHRLADGLRDMTPDFRRTNFDALPDDVFGTVESRLYADAAAGAKAGIGTPAGQLNSRTFRNDTGHQVTEYFGDNMAWMQPFMLGGVRARINRNPSKAAS